MPVTRNAFNVIQVDLTSAVLVAHAPTTVSIELKPPKGYAYEIVAWEITIPDPVGSTAGTHLFQCFHQGDTNIDNRLWQVSSNTGTSINAGRYFQLIGTSESPSLNTDQANVLRGACWATYDFPIIFSYTNSTDVDQTGTRTLKLLVKKYPTGS